ncbi:MAG: hypothetical protein R3337_02710 [Gammaproteobacteria bacterium]|nr:hypothetical protein [Gammaproteobacteria bacterium]
MSRLWVAAILGAWLWPMPAAAGSNLAQGYPAHQCGVKPEQPQRPEKFRDRAELDAYNEKVTAYNQAMERYVECLQSYVNNAAEDIRVIREKIDATMQEVNQ